MIGAEWVRQTKKLLQNRTFITPGDLPAFGSRVTTKDGMVIEVVGWFDRNPKEKTGFGDQRLCFGFQTDGKLPANVPGGGMVLAWFPENLILRSEPQTNPKFAEWLIFNTFLAEPPAGA